MGIKEDFIQYQALWKYHVWVNLKKSSGLLDKKKYTFRDVAYKIEAFILLR